MTILFADVVESTRLAAGVDAEAVREKIGTFFRVGREEIERYGGTVEKFIGDAVMAVFGLPATQENDAERAVRAALRLQFRIQQLVDVGTVPPIRIGISTGEVIADPRAVAQGEFMVTGEAVSLAARLQQAAEPGRVLVGEETYRATWLAFDYRPIPELRVKGRAERLVAYEPAFPL